ncbi:MAG: hypothetical protein ABI759_32470 [Candidatus Solibacter sp.]
MAKVWNARLTRRQAILWLGATALSAAPQGRRVEEVRRLAAPEANQAVAADDTSLYAIGNHEIGRYDKKTGKRLAGWECETGKPLIHLDSGVVHEGTLYCAHSNYPGLPMVSSIEMWDAATLRHTGSHSFGIFAGSATWVDGHQGYRYVTFAHYRNSADEPGRDARWTTLIQFDAEWRQRQAWVYPAEVVSRLGDYSISGGVFTPDHKLFCTGHDNPEIYVLTVPESGSSLLLVDTFPVPMKGQGIALDPADPGLLYGIDRAKREIVVVRIRNG